MLETQYWFKNIILIVLTMSSLWASISHANNNPNADNLENYCRNFNSSNNIGNLYQHFKTNTDITTNDFSLWIISNIFGVSTDSLKERFYNAYITDNGSNQEFQYVNHTGSAVFGTLFSVFNKTILIAGLILMLYNIFFAILETSFSGKLEQNFLFSFFLRLFLSILILLPVSPQSDMIDGYTWGQMMYMKLITSSIGAANTILAAAVCTYSNDNTVSHFDKETGARIVQFGWLYSGFHYSDIFNIANLSSHFTGEEDSSKSISIEEFQGILGYGMTSELERAYNPDSETFEINSSPYLMSESLETNILKQSHLYHQKGLWTMLSEPNLLKENSSSYLRAAAARFITQKIKVETVYKSKYGYFVDDSIYTPRNRTAGYNLQIFPDDFDNTNNINHIRTFGAIGLPNFGKITINQSAIADLIDENPQLINQIWTVWDNLDRDLDTAFSTLFDENLNVGYNWPVIIDIDCDSQGGSTCPAASEHHHSISTLWKNGYGGFFYRLTDDYEPRDNEKQLIEQFVAMILQSFHNFTLNLKTTLGVDSLENFEYYFDFIEPYAMEGLYLDLESPLAQASILNNALRPFEDTEKFFAQRDVVYDNLNRLPFSDTEEIIQLSFDLTDNNSQLDNDNEFLQANIINNDPSIPIKTSKDYFPDYKVSVSGGSVLLSFGQSSVLENVVNKVRFSKLSNKHPIDILKSEGKKFQKTATDILIPVLVLQPLLAFGAGICRQNVGASYPVLTGLQGIIGIALPISGILWSQGVLLSVVLPLIPLLIWLVAIVSWICFVIEGMVAINLVGLSMLWPNTQNNVLARAEPTIFLLMNAFLRPSLYVLGLISSIVASYYVIGLYANSFAKTAYIEGSYGWIIALFAYIAGVIAITRLCFNLIYMIPDKIISWLGISSAALLDNQFATTINREFENAINDGNNKQQRMLEETENKLKGFGGAAGQVAGQIISPASPPDTQSAVGGGNK